MSERFLLDFILLFPLGLIRENVKMLHLIKLLRILRIADVLKVRIYNGLIRKFYQRKLNAALANETQRLDMEHSFNYIQSRLNAQYFMHVVRVLLILILFVFLLSVIWHLSMLQIHAHHPEEQNFFSKSKVAKIDGYH